MHRVTLLTGSNHVSAREILHLAAQLLAERIGELEAASEFYSSEPWGFSAERGFLNQALLFRSELEPLEVLDVALDIEQRVGRRRDEELREKLSTGERYASRVVDIDVMFYDDRVIRSERLSVPHPLLHRREFALRPLCEIMGDVCHPVLGIKLKDIDPEREYEI